MLEYTSLKDLIKEIERMTRCRVSGVREENRYWILTIINPKSSVVGANITIKVLIP